LTFWPFANFVPGWHQFYTAAVRIYDAHEVVNKISLDIPDEFTVPVDILTGISSTSKGTGSAKNNFRKS
jgi:hypothetical protein